MSFSLMAGSNESFAQLWILPVCWISYCLIGGSEDSEFSFEGQATGDAGMPLLLSHAEVAGVA